MPELKTLKRIFRDYAVVIFAPVALFLPLLIQGQVLFWGTPSLQFIPWWMAAWNSLKQGVLPLWNPLNGLGAPLLANYQSAFFYPPNWLLLLLAGAGGAEAIAWGFSFLAIFHLAWGGLGMALLLRRLQFPYLAQVIGGLAFGLSGYLIGRIGFFSMVWAGAWLPWVIFFTDHIASPDDHGVEIDQRPRFRLHLGLTACFAMQLLSGHAQLTWYTILLAAAWVTVGACRSSASARWPRRLAAAWASFGVAILFAVGIAMIQLAPTFEYLRFSHRADAVAYEEALTYSFWPWRLVSIFSPDFFGNPVQGDYWGYASYWEDHVYLGLLPLLLALSSLWLIVKGIIRQRPPRRWRLLVFMWVMIVAAFILAFGKYTPVFPFLYRTIPTFSMFQAPARYLLWVAFALPVLAAISIEHWRSPTGKGLYWFRLGTAGAFAVTLGAGLTFLSMHNIRMTFIRATALTGVWALGFGLLTLAIPYVDKINRKSLWQWAVIAWTLCDLLIAGWNLNVGVPANFYAPISRPAETVAILNHGERVFLSQQDENDLKFQRFFRFKDFRPIEDWKNIRYALLPDTNLFEGLSLASNFDPLTPETYQRWMSLIETLAPKNQTAWLAWMGVGVIEHIDVSQPSGVRYNSIPGAQRLHWYTCARFSNHPEQIWADLEQEMQVPPRQARAVLLEGTAKEVRLNCSADPDTSMNLILERQNHIVVKVNAQNDGWLELMDTYYPGWVARIDGKDVTLYQADGNFRAVKVGQGQHQIEFLYIPSGFYFGVLFSILVLVFVFIVLKRRGLISERKPYDYK